MMKNYQHIVKRYTALTRGNKLHIFARLATVPWGQITDSFPRGETLIDIGCGHGLLINLLRESKRFKKMIGIDPDENKIRIAQQAAGEGISFFQRDLVTLAEGADVYSIFDVLYLIPFDQQEAIMRHIFKRLPKNGYLIIKEVNNKPGWKFSFLRFQESIMVKLLHFTKGKDFYFRSEEEYDKLLKEIGFSVSVKYLDRGFLYPHILYVCKKIR